MKAFHKRLAALVLSLCLVLGLAACGSKEDGGKDGETQLSGTVYVPEFIDMDLGLGKNSYINSGCSDGKNVYILASIYPDWEAGEDGDTRYEIYRISLESGEPEKLENFQMPVAPEGFDDSYSYADSLRSGVNGNLWINVGVNDN